MVYELIKKVVGRPFPCDYCKVGWAQYSLNEVRDCHESCELYKRYLKGEVVVPFGFDEVREVKDEVDNRAD